MVNSMKEIFYGIEKTSLVDFEGYIACTIFTKGCNFRCPFCHNASLALNESIDNIPFNDILDYLNKRKNIIDAVCITGGEPTLNIELPEIIKKIKELDLLVKLDTNGSNPKMVKYLIDNNLIDYVAMDIKNGISGYSKITGINNPPIENIQETINILKSSNIKYEFRTTLVEEFHSLNDILEIGLLLKNEPILYLQHFVDHGTCLINDLHEVSKEKALEYQSFLQNYIKEVKLRGY